VRNTHFLFKIIRLENEQNGMQNEGEVRVKIWQTLLPHSTITTGVLASAKNNLASATNKLTLATNQDTSAVNQSSSQSITILDTYPVKSRARYCWLATATVPLNWFGVVLFAAVIRINFMPS